MSKPDSQHGTTTATGKVASLADMEAAVKALGGMNPADDWILVAPDGRVWKAAPEELLKVLMPHHPLLKPLTLKEMLKT